MSEHNTTDMPDKGRLQIQVTSEVTALPISDAVVRISYTGVPDSQLEELRTDSSGQTETIELETPPLEYSLNPAIESQPYSEYTLPAMSLSALQALNFCLQLLPFRTYHFAPLTPDSPPKKSLLSPPTRCTASILQKSRRKRSNQSVKRAKSF